MYDWTGEADAERFVRTYADSILRLCLARGLTRQDAQDICQELFLKLLTTRRVFHDAEHEKAWALREAGNACKNLLRASHHSRRAPLEQAQTVAAPVDGQRAEVRDEVEKLPPRYRDAVRLYYLAGYSADEVACILRISPAAVRKRLDRARDMLKTGMEGAFI